MRKDDYYLCFCSGCSLRNKNVREEGKKQRMKQQGRKTAWISTPLNLFLSKNELTELILQTFFCLQSQTHL